MVLNITWQKVAVMAKVLTL